VKSRGLHTKEVRCNGKTKPDHCAVVVLGPTNRMGKISVKAKSKGPDIERVRRGVKRKFKKKRPKGGQNVGLEKQKIIKRN